MSHSLLDAPTAVEMTADARFAARVRRLIAVSAVALGAIFVLALRDVGGAGGAAAMAGIGWLTMPAILALSLQRPRLRYLLALPATLVAVAVAFTALSTDAGPLSLAGWWMISAGIGMGGGLGMWLWFRWLPVPEVLDAPFSAARWTLIGIHAGLTVIGLLFVLLGSPG